MKAIVFDSGPVISMTTNNLLWLLKHLKELYKGDFIIPEDVQRELVFRPLETKKFKLEALEVMKEIKDGTFKVVKNNKYQELVLRLLTLANNSFCCRGKCIQLVHLAEMAVVATAIKEKAEAIVVDERTTRLLIEDPKRLHNVMERKLHMKIDINSENLNKFRILTKDIRILRSLELVMIAYEKGLLDNLLPETDNAKKILIESIAWGLKLNGCSVAEKEIKELLRIEK